MNIKDYAVYQALEGVSTFASTYAASFPAGSEGAKDFARVDPLLVKIGKPDLNPGVPASPAICGKGGEQDEDKQDSTAGTARIRALIKEGRELLKALATSVTNRFRRDPEVLAKWHTASHIQRAPRKREDEVNAPPVPPAPPVQ